jgi:nucleoside-diphosphate-sugar epimerase
MRYLDEAVTEAGGGVTSFIHLDDAAAATVLAVEQGVAGVCATLGGSCATRAGARAAAIPAGGRGMRGPHRARRADDFRPYAGSTWAEWPGS